MKADRLRRLVGLAALLGALGAPCARAAGPKVSSASVIVDDLTVGAAATVHATGGGSELDGGLGQLATELGTAGADALESGYFSLLASTPNSPAASEVDGSSAAFAWSNAIPANPAGTAYVVDLSTDSGFGGTLVSSSSFGLSGTVTGLRGNTTYYSRIRASYSEGDDSTFVNMGQSVTQALPPAAGSIFDAAPFTARASWDPFSNTVGEVTASWPALSAFSNLPAVRQSAALTYYGGRLYLSGGSDPAVSSGVFTAAVQSDGSLSAWSAVTPLPAARESHAMAAWGGRLYAAGGSDGTPRATVWWAPILADGSLGAWTATASLPAARTKLAMTAWDGHLVATGGDDGAGSRNTVYWAALNDDGTITSWNTSAATLPAAVSGHAMSVSSGTLYASGGSGAGVSSAVWWTSLTGGVPGTWNATASLPTALKFHAMSALDGKLFVTGGSDGTSVQSTVYVGQISTDAAVSQWSSVSVPSLARFLHGMAASMDHLYVVGGSDGASLLQTVQATALGGTQYDAEVSTDAFATLNDSSGWRAGAAFDFPGLTPNTAYSGRVRARNYAGVMTSYLSLGSTVTAAAAPVSAASTFTAVSSMTLSFQWGAGGNPSGTEFLAQASTAADFTGTVFASGWLTATATGFPGLSVNTSYFVRARARNSALAGAPFTALGSTYTLAAPPTVSSITAASASALTLAWTSTANPAGTWYEAQVSSMAAFIPVAQTSVTQSFSADFSGLISASTFYARVRALNGNGVPSAFDLAASTTTGLDATPPGVATGTFARPSGVADGLTAFWTAPGDDGSAGSLFAGSTFYLQWSTSDPAGVSWSTASAQVVTATGPVAAGALASVSVGSLPDGQEVFFREWTQDRAGNFSVQSATFSAIPTPFSFEAVEGGGGFDAGSSPSLAVDRSGNLHAAYRGTTGTQELRYAKRTAGVWSTPVTVESGVVVSDVVLAVDSSGNPAIAYRDTGAPSLKVARFSGSWTVSVVESGNFTPGGVAVDASGGASVSYYDGANARLKYARYEGAAWSTSTVDNGTADTGRASSLALDASQSPHISYYDATNMSLKYASATASVGWSTSTVDSGVDVGTACVLALDGFGDPHVVYGDGTNQDVKYASRTASGWTIRAVESAGNIGGARLGLALDGAGNASVSYSDRGAAVLKYARWTGTAFSTQTVDSSADDGLESSLTLDGSGNAHIAYRDATAKSLKAAHWTGAALAAPFGGNARGRAQGPTGMAGSALSVSSVQWSWTDNASNELGFALFGALNSTGPYTLIADSGTLSASPGTGGIKSYTETGLTSGTTYYRYAVAVGSGGVVASAVASAFPQSTADVSVPLIVNNQLGDATTRRTNTGLYNVNFYDSGGSHLSNFSVKASTVPGGAGPDLIAYTAVLPSAINADAYTATWPLPTAVFNALLGGVTNYITIQVSDFAGNVSTGTDLFFVLRDTTVPSISGHVVQVSSQGITAVQVDCYDESGTLQATAFTQADGSGTFVLSGLPLAGTFRVQATWSADGVGNSVSIDSVPVDAVNMDFVLQLNYALATLQGTLQTLSSSHGSGSVLSVGKGAAFFDPKAVPAAGVARVELFQADRQVGMVPIPASGHWVIPNLLPGRYSVRAFNGIDYTAVEEVDLIDGEVKTIGFLSSPLPNEQVFAFPNPARRSTTIRFQTSLLPWDADIRIFDLKGQLVKALSKSAGEIADAPGSGFGVAHAVWDLTNMRGEPVASGVYFFSVKIRGGNDQSALVTKKLAVVR